MAKRDKRQGRKPNKKAAAVAATLFAGATFVGYQAFEGPNPTYNRYQFNRASDENSNMIYSLRGTAGEVRENLSESVRAELDAVSSVDWDGLGSPELPVPVPDGDTPSRGVLNQHDQQIYQLTLAVTDLNWVVRDGAEDARSSPSLLPPIDVENASEKELFEHLRAQHEQLDALRDTLSSVVSRTGNETLSEDVRVALLDRLDRRRRNTTNTYELAGRLYGEEAGANVVYNDMVRSLNAKAEQLGEDTSTVLGLLGPHVPGVVDSEEFEARLREVNGSAENYDRTIEKPNQESLDGLTDTIQYIGGTLKDTNDRMTEHGIGPSEIELEAAVWPYSVSRQPHPDNANHRSQRDTPHNIVISAIGSLEWGARYLSAMEYDADWTGIPDVPYSENSTAPDLNHVIGRIPDSDVVSNRLAAVRRGAEAADNGDRERQQWQPRQGLGPGHRVDDAIKTATATAGPIAPSDDRKQPSRGQESTASR